MIELFITGRKPNISLVFITQLYFKIPKNITLNSAYYFILEIPNKRELQQIAINHSSNIGFKDLQKYVAKIYSILVNDTTVPLNNLL